MLDRYLKTRYVRYGRGPVDLDCWGITRLARHELFGKSLLPAFDGICPDDKRSLTEAAITVRDEGGFVPAKAAEGAIATAWRGRLCTHVGIVVRADGRLWVLETDEGTGPCLTPPSTFEARYNKVIYYDD